MGIEGKEISWLERHQDESALLTEDQRLRLTQTWLETFIGITGNELAVFTDLSREPGPNDMDATFQFIKAERRIADYMNSPEIEEGTPEHDDYIPKRDSFQVAFRDVMKDFYSPTDFERLFSYMIAGDEKFLVGRLVGYDHPLMRRIRTTYVGDMSDFFTIYIPEE